MGSTVNYNGKMVSFSSLFSADAMGLLADDADPEFGMVLFNTDVSKPSATTVGGYRIDSGDKVSTSSGIGMYGAADSNERLVIESEELGGEQFVRINVLSGYLSTVDAYGFGSAHTNGQDMEATINGLRATTQGNAISLNTSDLSMSMNVNNAPGNYGFTITGGGALFQLGPDVVSQQQVRLGITSMLTTSLGGGSGTLFNLRSGQVASLQSDDAGRKLADRIVSEAISTVANTRGRLGATQKYTLEANVTALQDSLIALAEADAMITNADFAVESSNLTRLQLLIQAGAQTLGIANQLPQYAASLVR
jgi:flagellin